ncbi:multicopper oxidase domain-containing protein [Fodinibius sp.]|uniref:multicopper oxidase domain-containing protein n=1 Tax=Fodinibius sp. TaxID=1872440 RepID=UPI002ACED388|nr:multicopper oxidase domain-containing protein [Fodinibius sp.]MDZ7657702.1 multicopper oxidase domain-containing protein [Fodinibius sp.]
MKSIKLTFTLIIGLLLTGITSLSYAQTDEYEMDGKTFGMPEAEVFTEDYDGPPVVGDHLSLLPNLEPLDYKGNKTHEVRIDIIAQEIEVADGVKYEAWTFGGTVPGPVLHVREGDRITFTMKNRSDEEVTITEPTKEGSPFMQQVAQNNYMKAEEATMPMPHSMDFHAGTVAKDDKWRTIAPGQSIKFDWVANYAGSYIYHCGTPSVLMHTAMGQHGVVVVSPKEGYDTEYEVDKEYVIVQSEYYLKKGSGDLYQYDYEAAQNRNPSHVVFNGHQTILHDQPLKANAGDRVRFHVSNNGPSGTSSFHVIGGIFDRVWLEGHPFNEMRGMQTVLLGASSSATIDMIVPEEGKYILIDHEFADAEKGATGTLKAGPREK